MTKTLRLLMLPIVAISLLLFGITAANASTTKATNCGDQASPQAFTTASS